MMDRSRVLRSVVCVAAGLASLSAAFADKTTVRNNAPPTAAAGTTPSVQWQVPYLQQSEKTSVGAFVFLNDNYDSGNADVNGDPIPDCQPDWLGDAHVSGGDPDLQTVTLAFGGQGSQGSWSLDFDATKIRVWTRGENNQLEEYIGVGDEPYVSPGATPTLVPILIEGIQASQTVRDVSIKVTYSPEPTGNSTPAPVTDTLAVTVCRVDLDVDGDGGIEGDVDGVANYLPGYQGGQAMLVNQLLSGDGTWVNTRFKPQQMKIVLQPVGAGSGVDSVSFAITDVTAYDGYCGNKSDLSLTGLNTEDYSFADTQNERQANVQLTGDAASADFWCKDYGGWCQIQASLLRNAFDGPICTHWFCVPASLPKDRIAISWLKAKRAEWNTLHPDSPLPAAGFKPGDDNEPQAPNGVPLVQESYPATGPYVVDQRYPVHQTAGDGRSVADEYRGYILDGGGFDLEGATALAAPGHLRLSPGIKEFLVDVYAMHKSTDGGVKDPGVINMPDRAGICSWMDTVSLGYGKGVNGAGVRLYYVISSMDSPYDNMDIGGWDSPYCTGTIAAVHDYMFNRRPCDIPPHPPIIDPTMATFKHLLLLGRYADTFTPGLGPNSDAGASLCVDPYYPSVHKGSPIPFNTVVPPAIAHELHHTLTTGRHFEDANGNGVIAEGDDQERVLWNYDYPLPNVGMKITDSATATATAISLTDWFGTSITFLSRTGGEIAVLSATGQTERILYEGINGNTLQGCTRGYDRTVAQTYSAGDPVTVTQISTWQDLRRIEFGYGSLRHVESRFYHP